ncbi:uncharacterized protein LOC125316599 [Rhodamnia argentea]|uniref:Uncharacterized protein LOC125316599 n=1 Tax=Rhodamnia argentea TaxID=178133 RepID=A0ABM3HXK9_9MYRT|nr:uncharacterized protein LOC125316599 [Rhodamnia argentea]
MRYIQDLGPMAKFVAMRNLSQISPQSSVPRNEVPHLQMETFPYVVPNISLGPFQQVAAARSVHQGSVHQKAGPALTDFSYRNPGKPLHLNVHSQSSNFYGGNVLPIGGMNRSEDPRSKIPEASHTLGYPTHQTGQTHFTNKGLDIRNDSERNMTVGIPYSSSFYKPIATTLYGNPNPFATGNIAPDSHGRSFSNMMKDAMRTDGQGKMGEVVSSYPGMHAIAAKRNSPLLPSWQEPSLVASSFIGNDHNDLGHTLQAASFHEESSPGLGQMSNWVSPTNEGSSNGAGRFLYWLIPGHEASSTGAGPVPNWLSLGHGGVSDQVSNYANPVTSKPQFFEFLCPQQSGPTEVDVMGQARIPQPQDQAPRHDTRLGSFFDVQDGRSHDPKGKSIMENPTPSVSQHS